MDNLDRYPRTDHNSVKLDALPTKVAPQSDLTQTRADSIEFFDIIISSEAKILNVAPHAENPARECSVFTEHQGKLLPKNGDSAHWLKLVRLTCDTSRPNIVRLDNGTTLTHVTIAPVATDNSKVRVLLERTGPCAPDIFNAYCKLYHLTKAEAAVVWLLTQGLEPKRIAAHNSVAVSTVRTQIKTALLKTEEASIRTMLLRITSIAYGHTEQQGRPGPGVRRTEQ